MVKIGVQIHPQNTTMAALRAGWQGVDQLGVDSLWTWDHFFPPLYGSAAESHFEGWQILAAMAVTTANVTQIGMLVTGCCYRNPDLLADMARTLDHLSGGRAVLGIGSGWMDRDEIEYGYPVRTPAQRLDALGEALPRIRRRIGLLQPGPLGRLPILIGGNGERRTLRLVAEHADMWNGYGDAATIRAKNRAIDRWCGEIGRDPGEIERTVWIERVEPDLVASLVEAGADHLILGLRAPYDLGAVERLVAARRAV
ncbi:MULTISPECIES: LLM class F420-dependent oxidoreductase [Mycobacterium]|uniref:LLM class F420-dependent oxidoreductase n=1 Tax=Mycobacterium kiyosense TaxID=2871094 RepID=A0A9P3QDH5_9MYCO|nr:MULTISPECIES: LLM class F420-dependent oxidoreductase [Mycobacterium]BDB41192.1 LLM class F420-dependent oxidoreductase [Mycobacterium kiyosense]BDE12984.1 LLM class F420-dependent oxidoreductase [Mycobacterium sp. 20KCMC460]GLB85577.1 LLM class F420-dependent oxidoreductase [Mycobacterium kiyosense]GLB92347.1 LLM class F420-dependent oxidoreductase [Mycobacterium kiyosense]GLB98414.1 LLM class F420-dependent oxidoreductase [Mycobacterium kiyosense]